MTRSVDSLFRPFSFNGLDLPNRIVMAAMSRYMSPGGVPTKEAASYYRRRAENGCGLIIGEAATIDLPNANGYENTPYFWGDEALNGWKRIADEVHDAGGRIIPQLWHVGMLRATPCDVPNFTPSGIELGPTAQPGVPMSKQDIRDTVDSFARAAYHARRLGFDGVQLHGAAGYLIDWFLWDQSNKRTDEYGGDFERRARFAVEIVEAVRRDVGSDFPLMIRISQFKQQDYDARIAHTPEELDRLLRPMTEAGIDMYDCSQRRYWEPEYPGSPLNLAGWVKKVTGKPVITVGSVTLSKDVLSGWDLESATHGEQEIRITPIDPLLDRLERDEFDLVAVGRAVLCDPEWAIKIRDNRFDALIPFSKTALETLY